ncbi:MAG: hypothetical protein J6J86_01020 [Lachnospiraceae bacterium]|nr:hypothetical protein [Lachnospiraceae bacterium]
MANIVESLMDKIKFPEKMDLSHTDRQLLQKLSASVEELKAKDSVSAKQLITSEERLLAQISGLSKDVKKLQEACAQAPELQVPEITVDFSELKQHITDETEKSEYKVRGLMEAKADAAMGVLKAIQTSGRDAELIKYAETLSNRMLEVEAGIKKQLRTVKIMMGFTIWISIMALAAMVAQVLGLV